jgi:plasmid stabilization system protein ParE
VSFSVVFLKSAEQDIKELKHYVIRRFGIETWQSTLNKLKESIHTLQTHPQAGKVPDELVAINSGQYRQIISSMNRVIYEIRRETIYIHIVCDNRRDMQGLLNRRMMRGE